MMPEFNAPPQATRDFVRRTVVSHPDAVLRVEELELTPYAIRSLTVNAEKFRAASGVPSAKPDEAAPADKK